MLHRNTTRLLHRSTLSHLKPSPLAKSAKLPLPFHAATTRAIAAPTHTAYGLQHLARKAAPASSFHTATGLRKDNVQDLDMGAVATPRVDTTERVEKLRSLMKEHKLDAYAGIGAGAPTRALFPIPSVPSTAHLAASPGVLLSSLSTALALHMRHGQRLMHLPLSIIPSEDAHASEYPAECDLRRGYITGFTGSAGTAIVTLKAAALFTDGRYFLQAAQQLQDPLWTLMKQGEPNVPTWQEYLSKDLPANSRIGLDPALVSADDCAAIAAQLEKQGSSLVSITQNLVDATWTDGRPSRPAEPVFVLPTSYAGASTADKLRAVREELARKGSWAKGYVASMLDEVAWLFNLRGSDVPYNPVFFAFALVTPDEAKIYVNTNGLPEDVVKHVEKDAVLRPYETFYDDLKQLGDGLKDGDKIVIGKRASQAVQVALGGESRVRIDRSIIVDLKSVKNSTELEGFRQSHIRDGVALASYFAWLEEALGKGEKVSEARGADELEACRKKLEHFRGLSFTTISSTGPNGAIIHYSPDPKNCPDIDAAQLYLCDSGAQFTDGTTDVTRTWHFGKPAADEVRAFTRVLQGHIAIDRAVFPSGTTGYLLDPLARRPLWEDGLDFRHGVGHGVGHFLNVHEGPQGIGTRAVFNETALKEGMVISNEPGYYQDGAWGIRIENLVIVRKVKTPNNFGSKGFLGFEHLTLCPIQVSLIDKELLTTAERDWINAYHDETLQKVGPLLQKAGDERGFAWLKRQCEARV